MSLFQSLILYFLIEYFHLLRILKNWSGLEYIVTAIYKFLYKNLELSEMFPLTFLGDIIEVGLY